eukprot:TRINITY_DN1570_c0_g1_i7.p2 TRINITY_DN1570_c0_g1~~TRINITY_DN1570_c0_g1_i7.p2  ORF type:complete len:109 (+),score=6.22 TRINITY_DN1570_c0_g1_i7:192-518(+)
MGRVIGVWETYKTNNLRIFPFQVTVSRSIGSTISFSESSFAFSDLLELEVVDLDWEPLESDLDNVFVDETVFPDDFFLCFRPFPGPEEFFLGWLNLQLIPKLHRPVFI